MINSTERTVKESDVLACLPHAFPFRFVDRVDAHTPGVELRAHFSPAHLPEFLRGTLGFPEVCVIEGMAQATVLLVMLETGPLMPGDTPLLGSVSFEVMRSPDWDEELVYVVRPLRITPDQGVFEASTETEVGLVAQGTLVVRIRRASP